MLPPPLIRRLVLAPLAIVVAMALIVLFPLLALVALTFGAVGRSRPGADPGRRTGASERSAGRSRRAQAPGSRSRWSCRCRGG